MSGTLTSLHPCVGTQITPWFIYAAFTADSAINDTTKDLTAAQQLNLSQSIDGVGNTNMIRIHGQFANYEDGAYTTIASDVISDTLTFRLFRWDVTALPGLNATTGLPDPTAEAAISAKWTEVASMDLLITNVAVPCYGHFAGVPPAIYALTVESASGSDVTTLSGGAANLFVVNVSHTDHRLDCVSDYGNTGSIIPVQRYKPASEAALADILNP